MSGKEQVNIQLFHKWDMNNIAINDPGLKTVINLKPAVIPVTFGRHEHQRLKKAEVNIVERLANKLMHFGKKYAKNTGRMGGKKARVLNTVMTAFDIIHLETGGNPGDVWQARAPASEKGRGQHRRAPCKQADALRQEIRKEHRQDGWQKGSRIEHRHDRV